MGDRANVVVRDGRGQEPHEAVFLYSHWGGTELPETLRVALVEGRGRWNDRQYLARIIFDRMVGGDQGSEIGYGISTRLGDNEYDLLVLVDERVYRVAESRYRDHGLAELDGCDSISFADYTEAAERTWDNLVDA